MSPPEAPEHRTSTATSIGGRVPLRFPRLPLLAWVALATFALAFVAAAISSPRRYGADPPFGIFAGVAPDGRGGGGLIVTMFADITLHGHTISGQTVSAKGTLQIDFANFGG